MKKTKFTKDWPYPKGKCDMCNDKKATHWFGQTSVALCDSERCAERNQAKWEAMLEEMERESDSNNF